MGRVFDGRTFAPLGEGTVRLFAQGVEAVMVDPNWQNPFVLAGATGGTFIFWPRHLEAATEESSRRFGFEIQVDVPGLEGLAHFIEIESAPEKCARLDFSLQRVYKVPDLYLFPEGQAEDDS
jgi:competence protein ComFB